MDTIYKIVIGISIALGVTFTFENSYMMGLILTLVLLIYNLIICLIDKYVPVNVKLTSYIIILSTIVTIIEIILKEHIPALYSNLGIYLPLLVLLGYDYDKVNTKDIKTNIIYSLKLGLSFTLFLTIIGCIREVLGSNTLTIISSISNLVGFKLIYNIPTSNILPMEMFLTNSGAFITVGILLAVFNKLKVKHD